MWADTAERAAGSVTAQLAGEPAGSIIWEAFHRRHRVLINNIEVAPAHRRRGVARALVRRVMDRYPGYTLDPSTFATADGQALLDALGYPSARRRR